MISKDDEDKILNLVGRIELLKRRLDYFEQRCMELYNSINILQNSLNDLLVALSVKYNCKPEDIKIVNGKVVINEEVEDRETG